MAATLRSIPSPRPRVKGRALLIGVASVIAAWSLPSVAQQGMSCAEGVKGLTDKRQTTIAGLNALAHAGKGKLDPQLACPKLKALVGIEAQLSDYLVKNKEWCSIPDQVIDNLGASRAKTQKFAAQACNVAAQITKAKKDAASQAAAAAAQEIARLPAGPL